MIRVNRTAKDVALELISGLKSGSIVLQEPRNVEQSYIYRLEHRVSLQLEYYSRNLLIYFAFLITCETILIVSAIPYQFEFILSLKETSIFYNNYWPALHALLTYFMFPLGMFHVHLVRRKILLNQ